MTWKCVTRVIVTLKLSKNTVICTFIKEGSFWVFFKFLLLVITEDKCFPKLESSLGFLCIRGTEIHEHLPFFERGYLLFLCCYIYYKSHTFCESIALFCVQSKAHSHYDFLLKIPSASWKSQMFEECCRMVNVNLIWIHMRIVPLLNLSTEKPSCLLSWPAR